MWRKTFEIKSSGDCKLSHLLASQMHSFHIVRFQMILTYQRQANVLVQRTWHMQSASNHLSLSRYKRTNGCCVHGRLLWSRGGSIYFYLPFTLGFTLCPLPPLDIWGTFADCWCCNLLPLSLKAEEERRKDIDNNLQKSFNENPKEDKEAPMKTPLHLQVSLAPSLPPYQLWFFSSVSFFIQNTIDKSEEADPKVDWMKRVIKVQAGDINYLTWVKNNWQQSQWTYNERLAMPVVLHGWTGFRWWC